MVPMLIGGSLNSLGYGLATLGPALGVAWIFASVINGTARQPEARPA
ncbi:MAG: F0F1 ATP synthase subunit C, partial [Cutibacterium avidum]|nr:F0F1 ATP synthase subunit C [Cutibacterium avidum]